MLPKLFEEQRALLNQFFDSIDPDVVNRVFEKLLACKGVVILSGVGKSGHIAEKIAKTFSSTGTRSVFLSAAHALHGDIGFVSEEDVVLFLSKSGESQELLDLLPHLQRKGAYVIGCVSDGASRLAQRVDLAAILPVQRELCPYDLAPTTSTAVQLIFGDCLAIALMHARGFTRSDFAANHPAGFLGRKITLKTEDLMLKGSALPLSQPEQKLIDALHELSSKKCGCVLIVNPEKELLGIFTDGDLRRAIEKNGPEALQIPLKDLMNVHPKKIEKETLAFDAMREMEKDPARPVTVLPVIQQQKVVGLLRMHDILQAGLH